MKRIMMFVFAAVLLLSFYGCGVLDKTYDVTISNDTLDEVTIYFDGEKPEVLHKATYLKVLPLLDRCYFSDIEEGNYVVKVECGSHVYKQTLYVNRDLRPKVSELSDIPSAL